MMIRCSRRSRRSACHPEGGRGGVSLVNPALSERGGRGGTTAPGPNTNACTLRCKPLGASLGLAFDSGGHTPCNRHGPDTNAGTL